MIGFGILVRTLSHPVLYLLWVLIQHSPSSDFGENQLSRGLISLSLLLTSHLRIFQHPRVRSSTACYRSFNLLISRSPPLRVYCQRLGRTFRTRFRFASAAEQLRLATDNNSQTHYAKGRRSLLAELPHIVCNRFQVYFTPLAGVLFTFPSRYLFTIGRQVVFSLIPWSGQIHAEFHVHRITWDSPRGL